MLVLDSVALMAIPELYRYGREGLWFGAVPFLIYMVEGVYQVSVHATHQKLLAYLKIRVLPYSSSCSIHTILQVLARMATMSICTSFPP